MLIASEEVRNYGKIVRMKNSFENDWWKLHTPHLNPLDPPLVISYRNHQKRLAYFSHFAILIVFFLLKCRVKGGGGAWHNTLPKYAPEYDYLLFPKTQELGLLYVLSLEDRFSFLMKNNMSSENIKTAQMSSLLFGILNTLNNDDMFDFYLLKKHENFGKF